MWIPTGPLFLDTPWYACYKQRVLLVAVFVFLVANQGRVRVPRWVVRNSIRSFDGWRLVD
ncbi:uncharacterized protein METZ01_LOCUS319903 [marine metagenome]|uniref:Uncharacterized protein n=1 Tax=marine metagenome TaxID=408172 RepID=A0A382P0X0_9ZZZZ